MGTQVAETGELRRNVLPLSRLAIQGLAVIGPSITVAVLLTGVAGVALSATPLVFVIATIAVLINANTAIQYSKKISSAGGFYTYVSNGLGPKIGILSGLYQLFYQVTNIAFLALWNGYFIGAVYGFFTGVQVSNTSMLLIALVTVVFYFAIQYLGVKVAVEFNFITGLIESAFLVLISFVIIAVSYSANTAAVFTPGLAGFSGVGLGMIFALLSFGGYTTIVSLSEEAKNPKETIGRAIIFTVLLAGGVFIITTYAMTIGWGYTNMAAFAALPLPGFTVVKMKVGIVAAFILALIVLSSNLNAVNGQMINISRVVFRMARDRVFPEKLGSVHPKFRSPYMSLIALTIVSTVVMLLTYAVISPLIDAVFLLATFATVGTIMVHTLSNISLIRFSIKIKEFKVLLHGILPVAGTLLILYALYASVWPAVFPFYLAPIALIIWTVLSILYVQWISHRKLKLEDVGKFTL